MKQSTSFLEGPDDATTTAAGAAAGARVAVPALEGVEPHMAVERLQEAGLVPVVESREVAEEDLVGVVCAQDPEAESELEAGGVVVVVIGERAASDEPQLAREPDVVEEDDGWFDIELPGESSRDSRPVASEAQRDAPSTPERARTRRVGALRWRAWRTRRIVVLGVIALVALAVAAVSRSSAPQREATPAPRATSTRSAVVAPEGARVRAHRPQRSARPTEPRAAVRRRARRPSHPSVPAPVRPVSSSAPSHRSAPAQPSYCEFCLELAGH